MNELTHDELCALNTVISRIGFDDCLRLTDAHFSPADKEEQAYRFIHALDKTKRVVNKGVTRG